MIALFKLGSSSAKSSLVDQLPAAYKLVKETLEKTKPGKENRAVLQGPSAGPATDLVPDFRKQSGVKPLSGRTCF